MYLKHNTVEPRFSERQPSEKPCLSGNFSEDQFFLFSKNMQPSGKPHKSGKSLSEKISLK